MSYAKELSWTKDELARALTLKRNGRSFREIGEAIGRSRKAVQHKLGSRNTTAKVWTEAQVEHLRDNLHKTDEDLAAELCALGPGCTQEAVKAKRKDLKVRRKRPAADGGERPWPTLRGTDEERDQKFVRLVLAEAYRLGLARAELATQRDKANPQGASA